MTALENFYFGNINPSEYKQDKDTKKKLAEMTKLLDELRSMLTTEEQKEKLEQIESYQLSLIALSEKDAYIEGFKLGVRMTTAPTIRLTADNPAQTTIRAINSLAATAAQALSHRAAQGSSGGSQGGSSSKSQGGSGGSQGGSSATVEKPTFGEYELPVVVD